MDEASAPPAAELRLPRYRRHVWWLVGVAIVATPLQGLIASRLHHEQSNSIRASLSATAIQDANAAPVIGYGDTRHQQGSASSIAVGPTSDCPECGQYPVGSNGQLYLLLVCTGWAGTGLFLAFFAYLCWRYRHDKTPYGMAGSTSARTASNM